MSDSYINDITRKTGKYLWENVYPMIQSQWTRETVKTYMLMHIGDSNNFKRLKSAHEYI